MDRNTHACISTHRTDHLALAAGRLMQNTTRLGRWQLRQEVSPQQAKETCSKEPPGYEKIGWTLTASWAAAQKGERGS